MKKNKLFLGLAVATAGLALASCGGDEAGDPTKTPGGEKPTPTPVEPTGPTYTDDIKEDVPDLSKLKGTYDATVWVSESKGMKELTIKQIDKFEELHPGITINATVEGISEANAATQMITSVEDGADLYCFAQDQLSRLVQANALTKLGKGAAKTVTEKNDAASIKAATVGDQLYAYPLTSDNGYFMYYDKSVIKAEHLDSLEDIIADCEAANKKISFELETNTWYNAAFFFGTGCHTNWTTNTKGEFTAYDDNFNSANGIKALKGMQKVLKSPMFQNSSSTADFAAAIPSAVVISGVWGGAEAKANLGDNLGATDLPSFTVDGETFHLTSFAGNKLMGVKPSDDATRTALLQQLALYLTGATCQFERYKDENLGWGPSNVQAQETKSVREDLLLSALNLQNKHSIVQGQVHGSWWDIGKSYAAAAKKATTDAELQKALDDYDAAIKAAFNLPDDVKTAWGVVGSFEGGSWTEDLMLKKLNDTTWATTKAINFKAGDAFKLRMGKSWHDGDPKKEIGAPEGGDFKITAETAGAKYIKVVFNAEGIGTVTLEDTNPAL